MKPVLLICIFLATRLTELTREDSQLHVQHGVKSIRKRSEGSELRRDTGHTARGQGREAWEQQGQVPGTVDSIPQETEDLTGGESPEPAGVQEFATGDGAQHKAGKTRPKWYLLRLIYLSLGLEVLHWI